ncbi:MAG: sigma-70 family RNA polymerase sigma factor [Chloroflexi bacterium]|nr:sigma-70 family RNA polymerase sigma factor [Chloroflexota bacterium]
MERMVAGDQGALAILYDRYARAVYSLALRMLADRGLAEDLVQEVFLRCWSRARQFAAERGSLSTWLLGITHHLAVDNLRRQAARPRAADPAPEGEPPLTARLASTSDALEEVWLRLQADGVGRALAEIPRSQRQAIELAYFHGLTHVEIAAHLGEPLGTVKTRIRLGMSRLRQRLGEEGLLTSDAAPTG